MLKLTSRFALIGLIFAVRAIADPRPAVVELFTSEGCSSCPPAERILGELAQRNDVLALSFHVDYWDGLGWRDRFGLPTAAVRQQAYVRALRLPSAYTPQVVIDGQADLVGSDRRAIIHALEAARAGVVVTMQVSDGNVVVDVGAGEGAVAGDVIVVTYQRFAATPIGRGENAGRTLQEFNIVRSFRNVGRWAGARQRFTLPLDSLPHDATDLAVLVQAPEQSRILGAATRPLPNSPSHD